MSEPETRTKFGAHQSVARVWFGALVGCSRFILNFGVDSLSLFRVSEFEFPILKHDFDGAAQLSLTPVGR